jgi:uncharacterized protein
MTATTSPAVRKNSHSVRRVAGWFASWAVLVTGLVQAQTPPSPPAPQPSFSCAEARHPAEQLVCASAEASGADVALHYLYEAVHKKAKSAKGRAKVRTEQLRWLRTVRNACPDTACVLQVYRTRIDALTQRNNQVLDLSGHASVMLFEHRLPEINDSAVVRGLALRSDTTTPIAIELETDLRDARGWTGVGPRVEVRCTEPGRQEGYAGDFDFHTRVYGLDFQRVQRAHDGSATVTYRVAEIRPGKDIPLNKDARCAVGFGEWLLDFPSTLRVLRD